MSGYPISMQESIKKLEATRSFRLTQDIPRMTFAEREALLKQCHPDYRSDSNRTIEVGPNKGQKLAINLVDLLEAKSRVNINALDLNNPDFETDVLVVGGGGGGVSAAITANEQGARVIMATKLRVGDSNTIMAEGGIAAATQGIDSPERHYLDTLGGGRFMNKRDLIKVLTNDAPLIVEWLKDLGCMFDTHPSGDLVVSFAGGQQRKRVHSCKDTSGLEFMRVLRDELYNRNIPVLEFAAIIDVILDEKGNCAGAVMLNMETQEQFIIKAKSVILATGGIGRLHPSGFPTTNHYGATADGLIVAYRAGANLLHMDAIQFHPTGAVWPHQMLGQLITEAMRGNGAQLVNINGERFINELETQDTTSSGIIREVRDRGNGIKTPVGTEGVWLDAPLINIRGDMGKLDRMFYGIVHRWGEYGIDVRKEPIMVFPTQHYQNGGVEIDTDGRTSVPGLYAAGEVAGGVQGRNRLGGNSLLDIFVFGKRSGTHAADYIKNAKVGKMSLQHVTEYNRQLDQLGIDTKKDSPLLLPDYLRDAVKMRRFS